MKIIIVMAMIHASVLGFPKPDASQPSQLRSGDDPDLGNLAKWNSASAAASTGNRLWTAWSGTHTSLSDGITDLLSGVTDHIGNATDQLLNSLSGSVATQLLQVVESLPAEFEQMFSDLPNRIPTGTSGVLVKVIKLGENYLETFGYMSESRKRSNELAGIIDKKSLSRSIRAFQQMAGLKPTGALNKETMRIMSMPRCGVEDTVGAATMGSNANSAKSMFRSKKRRRKQMKKQKSRKGKTRRGRRRSKRYNVEGGMWQKTHLKYFIENYTPDMTQAQVDDSIRRAFGVWAKESKLRFSRASSADQADLKISFGARSHDDPYPFDGKGGTLAHAFFPSDGRAHFDEDETFDYKGGNGVNLFIVAAHEFGHSLGLGHSSVQGSLMAPFYQGYVPNFKLHSDDIAGIQQLYGKQGITDVEKRKPRTTRPPATDSPTTPTKAPKSGAMDICGKKISFDATFFDSKKQMVYALKGQYYWKINDYGVVKGYPKKIRQFWKGLPPNVNAAAYSKSTGRTYFFKGYRMWRYDSKRKLESGFPRNVSDLGIPSHIDAATQWSGDGMIYIFKDGQFWRFSEYQRYDGEQRYSPKKISRYWNGIPDSTNAVLTWKNGKTYFFKGSKYWRFSGMDSQVDKNYPKSVKRFWIGCDAREDQTSQRLTQKSSTGRTNRNQQSVANPVRPKLARLMSGPPTTGTRRN